MTHCGGYWKKLMSFDTFEEYRSWCGARGKTIEHLRDDWKISRLLRDEMQICMDDIDKLAADGLRPIIKRANADIRTEVIKKVESFIKSNSGELTHKKTKELIAKTRGIIKTPTPPKFDPITPKDSTMLQCRSCGHIVEVCPECGKPTLKVLARIMEAIE